MNGVSERMPKVSEGQKKRQLVGIKEAAKILGAGYSRTNIFRLISQGKLIKGIHFIRPSTRILKIDVQAIREDWQN